MRNLFLLFLAILLFSSAHKLYSEVVIGGKAEISYSIIVNEDKLKKSILDMTASFYPSFSVNSRHYDFSTTGNISYSTTARAPDISIDSFELVLNPADLLTIKIGRIFYLPGTSEFISPTNYFARIDYEKLLGGISPDYILPNDILQLGFFIGNYYLLLTTAPFTGEFILPDTNSIWFPGKDIPKSIDVSFPFDQVLYLENLSYGDTDFPGAKLENIGLSAEAGGTISTFDFSLIFYHGSDNTPLIQGEIFFPQGLFENYDVIVIPRYRMINALGLNLSANISSLRLWGDTSYTFSKTFNTNRLSSTNFSTMLAKSPYLEYSLGASYEYYFQRFNVFILGEYKNNVIVNRKDYFIDNMLSSIFLGMIRARFFQNMFSSMFTLIYSIQDSSTALVLKESYSPSDDLELSVAAPIFFGDKKSDFGQFKNNHVVAGGVTWRF